MNTQQQFIVDTLIILRAWLQSSHSRPAASECSPDGSFWQGCQQVSTELTNLDSGNLRSCKVEPLVNRFRLVNSETDIPALENEVSSLITTFAQSNSLVTVQGGHANQKLGGRNDDFNGDRRELAGVPSNCTLAIAIGTHDCVL